MRYLLSTITTVAWALWFGGLATMFVVTRATFRESHELGRTANPVMFRTFEPYILVVAGVAAVAAIAWVAVHRSTALRAIAVLFVLSAIASGYAHYGVSRPMQSLSPSSEEWKSLHGRSMLLYTTQSALLALAGLFLPSAMRECKPSAS
jgi:hypothetical protein